MLDPELALVIGVIGALAAVGAAQSRDTAGKIAGKLDAHDLAPLRPWEGPPIPRFIKEKPEVWAEILEDIKPKWK